MNTTRFYIDCLCLLPLDFLYLSIGFCSILRGFRLVKVYRFWTFLDRTERHTNYPNVIRTTTLMHYLLALFHWNACLYYIIVYKIDKATADWGFPKDESDVLKQYLHALYWSTLTLTTIGDLPMPRSTGAYLFIIFELMFGLLLFATVLGHIANIVSCVSAARKDFQGKVRTSSSLFSLSFLFLLLLCFYFDVTTYWFTVTSNLLIYGNNLFWLSGTKAKLLANPEHVTDLSIKEQSLTNFDISRYNEF